MTGSLRRHKPSNVIADLHAPSICFRANEAPSLAILPLLYCGRLNPMTLSHRNKFQALFLKKREEGRFCYVCGHNFRFTLMGFLTCFFPLSVSLSSGDVKTAIAMIANLGIPAPILFVFKAGLAMPFSYHLCNGVRHLVRFN